ncbi:hypothetical protein LMG23994_04196 [Cupriavidus pinatubonensis]|uniref:Transposase IS110-like N-terminal domain-containing protein n=1 Tax=Cupriavidus pinatubonensis TaxID=248026 RepID=A0ABN7Z661_9BURK|nr:hypothetical protein LMG23994_04196 [Cupriavidus pinatubonensis]
MALKEWLEPDAGRPARPVLRGRRRSNASLLPDQVHGINGHGKNVLKKQLKRDQVLTFFANLPACLIGMEACGGAHHWARKLQALGHTVRLMVPQFVKPYVKTNKNDAADAEAICEAVARPNMRFVPLKNVEQQAVLALHRVRQGFVGARTAQANQIRGLLAEFGLVVPQGLTHVFGRVRELIEDASNELPGSFRLVIERLLDHLKELSAVRAFQSKPAPPSRRLSTPVAPWQRCRSPRV